LKRKQGYDRVRFSRHVDSKKQLEFSTTGKKLMQLFFYETQATQGYECQGGLHLGGFSTTIADGDKGIFLGQETFHAVRPLRRIIANLSA